MSKAVRFNHYGGVDVLNVVEVEKPSPSQGRVLVRVVTAGTNPGEILIREGQLEQKYPTTFPCGEGADFAGIVAELGEGVTSPAVGTAVLGWSNERSAQAEFVCVPAEQVIVKPESLSWEVAGALFIVASTAKAAVAAVAPQRGETILVSGAAGGVGLIVTQLVLRTGAKVVGAAGASRHNWLRSLGAIPVGYDDDLQASLSRVAPDAFDAVIDTVGHGYVDLAIKLGVAPNRINTIIDFEAASRHHAHADGSAKAESGAVLAEIAQLVADGELQVPIAAVYDLKDVRQAYTQLEQGHTGGKVVLRVAAP
ncbi:MAG: NADP-dependent oxidoreductase [Nostoc sp.]|uniref:NADP-dependent oxidoreductase n=1 Tax=Nostoc sp. TaxID=1180 RepID=UPI002FF1D965